MVLTNDIEFCNHSGMFVLQVTIEMPTTIVERCVVGGTV